ncbi:hypothetical protein H310_08856 [Aphanomyces invadans]|uniref:PAS domain-containing protein n=1 Tax=Aphanomyces invadans TaxID=157072 RepID=A0A024TXM9_9STRA|nr:hypothetical protein H310_08856 [Aphanomyces invadans]ETV98112.1 hypothetical protein H310_08856 [Aphanomyces invadans]|eukprot:XP_008872987.1 hypothetical protein H310_08856 [Aphanomyces invadans]
MDSNQFLIDDVMDTDDLGLIDGTYPFLANMSNMSLLQQQALHANPAMPPMHNQQRAKGGPSTHNSMSSNQYMHHNQQLRGGHMSPGHVDVDMMNQNNPAIQTNQSSLFQAYASQFGLKQPTMPMETSNQHGGDTSVEAYAALMGVKLESPRSMQQKQYQQQHQSNNSDMSRAQLNAQYFESLIQQSTMPTSMGPGSSVAAATSSLVHGHNMTSMTLPAGIGGGFHMNHHHHLQDGGLPVDAPASSSSSLLLRGNDGLDAKHTTADALLDSSVRIKAEKAFQFGPAVGSGAVGSQTLSPEMLSTMIQNNKQNSADLTSHSFGSGTWNASDVDFDKDSLVSKADKSRERNRDHSRKSRLRKKAFVECLKTEVKQLQMYKDLCEQNADLIAMVSLDQDRRVTYMTASYTRVLGYHEKKALQDDLTFFDLVHPDDVAKVRSELNRVTKFQDILGVTYNAKHSKGMYWKGELNARMCEQGLVLTTRVQRQPPAKA